MHYVAIFNKMICFFLDMFFIVTKANVYSHFVVVLTLDLAYIQELNIENTNKFGNR